MMERFSRGKVVGILGMTPGRLRYWERLGLVCPQREGRECFYLLQDLIVLRKLAQLTEQGLCAKELAESLESEELYRSLSSEQAVCVAGKLALSRGDDRVFDLETGQGILGFESGEDQQPRVVPLRRAGRPQNWMGISDQARQDGRLEDALEALDEALVRQPTRVDAWNNRGTLLLAMGRAAEAAESLRKALTLQPTGALIRYNLANALDDLGETMEAVAELGRALALNPDHSDSHFNRALGMEKLGRRNEALYHWKEFLRLEPSGDSAHKVREFLRESEENRVVPIRTSR